ncbi:MAG: SPOR domain-containing protein, partial [Flavobacteriales bacterium]
SEEKEEESSSTASTPKTNESNETTKESNRSSATNNETSNASSNIKFRVQIAALSSKKPKSRLKKPNFDNMHVFREENLYKYAIGGFNKYSNADNFKKRKVKRYFPGAFIVAFKNGEPINIDKAIELSK